MYNDDLYRCIKHKQTFISQKNKKQQKDKNNPFIVMNIKYSTFLYKNYFSIIINENVFDE